MLKSMERRPYAPLMVLVASILLFLSKLCPPDQESEALPVDSFSTFMTLIKSKNLQALEYWSKHIDLDVKQASKSLSWIGDDTEKERVMQISRQILMSPEVGRLYTVVSKSGHSHSANGYERGTPVALFCATPGAARHALLTHLSRTHSLIPLSELSMRDRERLLVRESVFRFMFVRHPFVRTLAAYRRATVGVSDASDKRFRTLMARLRGSALEPGVRELQIISFRMFLALLGNRGDYYQGDASLKNVASNINVYDNDDDLHPQNKFCAVQTVNYSFIGRIEHFTRDLLVVNNWLKIRSTALPPHHSSGAADAAASVFQDSRIRRKATRLLQDDLRAFGYSYSHF